MSVIYVTICLLKALVCNYFTPISQLVFTGVVDQDSSTRDLKSSVKNDSNTESVDTPFVCQRDGFFRDKGRCDIYYLCAGGDSLRLTCEPGTSFDPALNMCVWTKMVPGCNAKEDTVESSTDTDQGTDKEASDADGPKENRATPLLQSRLNPGKIQYLHI